MLLSGTDNHLAGMGSQGELIFPNQIGEPGYERHLNDRFFQLPRFYGMPVISRQWLENGTLGSS
jgi:arylsulfatase